MDHFPLVIVDLLFTLVNLGILALNVKLYTELFKNNAMQRRHEEKK